MRFADGVRQLTEADESILPKLHKAAKAIHALIDDVDYERGFYHPELHKIIWSIGDGADFRDGRSGGKFAPVVGQAFKDEGIDWKVTVDAEIMPPRKEKGWIQFWSHGPKIKNMDRPPIGEDAADPIRKKVGTSVAASLKAGRDAGEGLRRVSDAELLRAADEMEPDPDEPEPEELPSKLRDEADPLMVGKVRDEIEARYKKLASQRGRGTAKRAIDILIGGLPPVEGEEASPEVVSALVAGEEARKRFE